MLGSRVCERELFERFSIPFKGFWCQPADPSKTTNESPLPTNGMRPLPLRGGGSSKLFETIPKLGILSSADPA